jgi:AcrR family transcriptional regulator
MTDSVGQGGKRERLIASAQELLYRQGVTRTALADIAEAAGVPIGNVYYYFKTKDDLVTAAIDAHAAGLATMFATFERQHQDPRARLLAFIRSLVPNAEHLARHGCPHGSLCQELNKRTDGLDRTCAALMARYVDWCTEQFRLMGVRDARDRAITLMSGIEGAALLTNTFRDPDIMARQTRQLEHWLGDST